jgi:hypothetical protein
MQFELNKHYRRIVNGKIDFIRVDEIKDDQLKIARGVLSPVGIRIVSVGETLSSADVGWEKVCIL